MRPSDGHQMHWNSAVFLHLLPKNSVVSIQKNPMGRLFSIWCLITSKSRPSPVQPLADEWFQDKKNIHSDFLSFRNLRKLLYCYCVLCPHLSIAAWRDSYKELLLSTCVSKIHQQRKEFHVLCFGFLNEHLHQNWCLSVSETVSWISRVLICVKGNSNNHFISPWPQSRVIPTCYLLILFYPSFENWSDRNCTVIFRYSSA